MQTEYDVIIVGAGPAGATAAFELALGNVSVLVLEKDRFPRYKACGGGITHKTVKLLPFDISPVIEKNIHKIEFSHNYKYNFQKESDKSIMYCVMRDRFDQFLINKAIEKGAGFVDSAKVTDVSLINGKISVKTAKSEYQGKVIIGADGANSILARLNGLSTEIIKGVTLEAEIRLKNTDAGKFFDRVHIDWGTVPGGYAWIFPKNDHISVGVGCPAAVSKYLKTYYTNIIDNLNIPVADVLSLRAHSIPCRSKKGRYSNGNILLIGDSAGLTDGLTGEGIYYAIRSGQIAAKVITEYISGSIADIDQHYSVMINEEIMKELLAVFPILHIFHAFPYRAHRFIRDNDRAWNAFIRVLRGEKSYTSFPETLGYYRFMWKAIDNTAGMLYERNMKKFMRR